MKVLYVEDDSGTREYTKVRFEGAGLDLDVADSVSTALEMLQENKYKLIVADVMMPQKTGIDLAKILQKIKPEIRIVLCSEVPRLYVLEGAKGMNNVLG